MGIPAPSLSKAAALCCVWAILVGVSVPLDMINQVALNSRAPRPEFQSIFTSFVVQGTAGLLLLPVVLMGTSPWGKPTRWWTLLAGLYGSPIFFMPLAVTAVGSEVTVLCVLSAQLCTALLLDLAKGLVRLNDWQRLAGFALVLFGAFVNASDASHGAHLPRGLHVPVALGDTRSPHSNISSESLFGSGFGGGDHSHGLIQNQAGTPVGHDQGTLGSSTLLLLAVAAFGGAGVTIESSCNCMLAKDLGCWSRAACWDSFVSTMGALPIGLLFYYGFGAIPVLLANDWYRFLFSACCVGFFQSSMSVLPEKLGFTISFMCVKFGCLFTSTYIDAKGLGGMKVPVTPHRLISLLLVFTGCALFATSAGSESPDTAAEAAVATKRTGYGAAATGGLFEEPKLKV